MTLLFTATYPERARALILYAPFAKTLRAPDCPSVGARKNNSGSLIGSPGRWVLERTSTSRERATTNGSSSGGRAWSALARRRVLDASWLNPHLCRCAAGHHIPFLGDHDAITNEIEEFLTSAHQAPDTDRVLATVLFTDIVGSTDRAATLGDRAWRDLIEAHHALVRRELAIHRGIEVDTAGDGFMARFDGPARAIRCAQAIAAAVRSLGIEIRAGLHTGECEVMGDHLAGIAVHIAARVAAGAGPSEVRVSSTVKDLVAGSGIRFIDRGAHSLKGVPGEWVLFQVEQ
jgi:class 3 adenylate cyclase